MGERVHPGLEEGFTVVRWRLGYRLEGREGVAGPGQHLHVPHGTTHDWWNAGEEKARIVVEISPAARFEEMIKNLWGLAQDGKTDAKGGLASFGPRSSPGSSTMLSASSSPRALSSGCCSGRWHRLPGCSATGGVTPST